MILFTLEWYHVPQAFAELVFMYYEELTASVLVGPKQTKWFRFQIGVFQGCTLSTMLFDTAFNTVFEKVSKLKATHGYKFSHVDLIKLITGYADDIGILSEFCGANQEIIDCIQEWLIWSKTMKAKPRKCRATAMAEG